MYASYIAETGRKRRGVVPRAVWVLRHLYRIYPLLDMAPIQETNLCGT